MTDDELKDLIRKAIETKRIFAPDLLIGKEIAEEDTERLYEALVTARVSVTWDGDKP